MAAAQQVPTGHLAIGILTSSIGSYFPPPSNITNDELAVSAMTAGPPNSVYTCLISGALAEFLPNVGQEQSNG